MKTYLPILILCLSISLQAQDPHFSNFQSNILGQNPALAGQISQNDKRLQFSARSQWQTVLEEDHFKTVQASYDQRICLPIIGDFLAFGINLIGDERGQFPLQRGEATVALAYMKQLSDRRDRQSFLSVGVEGGLISYRLGRNDFTFDEQFDDPSSPGEFFNRYNFTVPDYGVGLSYFVSSKQLTDFSFRANAAISHLGKPSYRFLDTELEVESRLEALYMAQLGVVIPFSRRVGLTLRSMFQYQKPFVQVLSEAGIIFELERDRNGIAKSWLSAGFGWRQVNGVNGFAADAWVPSVGLTTGLVRFNFSYDANISTLRPVSRTTGAFELSVTFLFGTGNCDIIYCPRY